MSLHNRSEDRMEELKFLGSCSRCGIALQKTKSIHFVKVNKKARWDFPVYREPKMNLPWDLAVGVLCNECASQKMKPFWAVELRGDTVYNYTMVELEDSFEPDEELRRYMESVKRPPRLKEAPTIVKDAVGRFLSSEELSEPELAIVRWFVWQWIYGREDLPADAKEKISFLGQDDLAKYIEVQIKQKLGIDPFA